jgi:hypothetical protein
VVLKDVRLQPLHPVSTHGRTTVRQRLHIALQLLHGASARIRTHATFNAEMFLFAWSKTADRVDIRFGHTERVTTPFYQNRASTFQAGDRASHSALAVSRVHGNCLHLWITAMCFSVREYAECNKYEALTRTEFAAGLKPARWAEEVFRAHQTQRDRRAMACAASYWGALTSEMRIRRCVAGAGFARRGTVHSRVLAARTHLQPLIRRAATYLTHDLRKDSAAIPWR